MNNKPRLTIITVTYNDVWLLLKTMRSVFEQNYDDYEYIVIDGNSEDNTDGLVNFWMHAGFIQNYISEPDSDVYNAMNKGVRVAHGDYICFLNSGDIFADKHVLGRVCSFLDENNVDGLLGWGELNGQIWTSWAGDEAFKMASLGFCHQALFVRRALLAETPFDERPFKTDSDTRQLGTLFSRGAHIEIVPEVLAIRGGEPGISADLERTARSIANTLIEEYPDLGEDDAQVIIGFRRRCERADDMIELLGRVDGRCSGHIARMVLDTLFQRQAGKLPAETSARLVGAACARMATERKGVADIDRLLHAQTKRADALLAAKERRDHLNQKTINFRREESQRIKKLSIANDIIHCDPESKMVVSFTSFPARLKNVDTVVTSLLAQAVRPREIHLWLGRDEVPNRNWLPRELLELEDRGLTIHFLARTFHHYDKFMHNSDANRDSIIVLVDDDAIYPPTSLEHLAEGHAAHPSAIIANRCHRMLVKDDGSFEPYIRWPREVRFDRPSLRLLPTGVGGVLYPPGFLSDPAVTDLERVLSSAPYADDLWLKFCALARGMPSFATRLSKGADWYHRYTPTMWSGTLMASNVDLGLNDLQLARCAEWLDSIRPAWRSELLADDAVEVPAP